MSRSTRTRRWGLGVAAAVGISVLMPMTPAAAATWTVGYDERSGYSREVGAADPDTLVSTDGGATSGPATIVAPLAGWAAPTLGQWVSSDANYGTSTAGSTSVFTTEVRLPPAPIASTASVCVHAADAVVVRLNGTQIGAQPADQGEANAADPAECFDLPVAHLVGGDNTLEFEVSNTAGEMALWYRVAGSVTVDADAAPVLVLPDDIVVDATGPDGAVVRYAHGAIYALPSNWPIPPCTMPPGSTFPIGTTTVSCTATNPTSGATSTGSFRVTVIAPNQPPELDLPDDLTVAGTSSAGATVSYAVTATDDSGEPVVSCSPASGAEFPVGATVVDCTATDEEGLTDAGSFTVTVTAPAPVRTYLSRLGTSIDEGRNIRADVRALLSRKHSAATDAFADGRTAYGCRVLLEMDRVVLRYRGTAIPYGKSTNLRNLIRASRAEAGC